MSDPKTYYPLKVTHAQQISNHSAMNSHICMGFKTQNKCAHNLIQWLCRVTMIFNQTIYFYLLLATFNIKKTQKCLNVFQYSLKGSNSINKKSEDTPYVSWPHTNDDYEDSYKYKVVKTDPTQTTTTVRVAKDRFLSGSLSIVMFLLFGH